MDIIKMLAQAVTEQIKKQRASSYDVKAEVVRVEGDTVWIHIPGGVDETPVSKTIECKPGDYIQARISNGRGFLVGNATAPPTDDTKAKAAQATASTAQQAADDAQETAELAQTAANSTSQHFWTETTGDDAGSHITEVTKEEFKQTPQGSNLLLRSDGIALRSGSAPLSYFGNDRLSMQTGNALPFFDVDATTGQKRDFTVSQRYYTVEQLEATESLHRSETVSVRISDDADDVTYNFFHIFKFSVPIDTVTCTGGYINRLDDYTFEYWDLRYEGETGTAQVTLENTGSLIITVRVNPAGNSYAGENITLEGSDVSDIELTITGEVNYTTNATAPKYTLGTRSPLYTQGPMSYCLGEGLAAIDDTQMAFGKFNAISHHPFVFGWGTADDPQARKNLMEIDADGYIRPGKGLILKDTDGTEYTVIVDTNGQLQVTPV